MKQLVKSFFRETIAFAKWLYIYIRRPKTRSYCHEGEKIVVVGNGPSARDFPFYRFIEKGYNFCCVNFFALDEELFFKVKPAFYCCIDPAFTGKGFKETEKGAKLINILERVDWEMTFLCVKGKSAPVCNEHITFHHINQNTYMGEINGLKNLLFNRNIASCGFQNVVVSAVYYFIMSRASEVLLTGVENNWHRELFVSEDNNVYREDVHFYGTERLNLTQLGEIGKGELYKYFFFYYITLQQYYTMSMYAQRNCVDVYNTCLDSYIDVFRKRSVENWH